MSDVVLYSETRPGYHPKSAIFDPVNNPTGRVVAKVSQLVLDDTGDGGYLYRVTAVDDITKQPTFAPAKMQIVELDDAPRVVSYGNDVHRLYIDRRTTPATLRVDGRFFVYGSDNDTYRIVRNPGQANQEVVSRYYDANGVFTSNLIPMARVADNVNQWWFTNCQTTSAIAEGDEFELQVFNSQGGLTVTCKVFTKDGQTLNELGVYVPVIVGIRLNSSQLRGNNEVYIFEKQSINDLNLTATLTYDDGREVQLVVDSNQTFLFGLENFIASYPGMRQPFMIKYWLSSAEQANPQLSDRDYVSVDGSLVVIPNELASSVKISTIPVWSTADNAYKLRYFLYTTDRTDVRDVTASVTLSGDAFNGRLYGVRQSLVLQLDMQQVFPSQYSEAVTYQQPLEIELQPIAALQRYSLADTVDSGVIYGVETPDLKRPRIYYDVDRQQYYISSTLFVNSMAFLAAFYQKASPLYLADSELAPVTPSHFIVRDAHSGVMLTAAPISITEYSTAWSILGAGGANRLVGNTVVIEFVKIVSPATIMILYGVPVDVASSPSGYLGP